MNRPKGQGSEGGDPKGKEEKEQIQRVRNRPKGHEREGTDPECKEENEQTRRARK